MHGNFGYQVLSGFIYKYVCMLVFTYQVWWESQNERDHWEDQDVDVWTILKWILER
jgi:hypothetical protein